MCPVHLPGPHLSFAYQLQELAFLLLCEVHHVDFLHRSLPRFHLGILRESYIRQNSSGKILVRTLLSSITSPLSVSMRHRWLFLSPMMSTPAVTRGRDMAKGPPSDRKSVV